MSNSNTKKRVLVTGGGRGIGRAIALRLANDGYEVACAARTQADLDETRALSSGKIAVAALDVCDARALRVWIDENARANGRLWGLVTAAGIHGVISPFIDCDFEEWKAATEVNLNGTALASQLFARALRDQKLPGRIVMLSGGGATQPIPNLSAYCASKAAVVRFCETLAHEIRELGITVNAIAPGAVNTAITKTILEAGPGKAGKALYEKAQKQLTSGGEPPEKAAALASYLLSETSAPISGRLLSAVWDDWKTLHEKDLSEKDWFTLRRVTP